MKNNNEIKMKLNVSIQIFVGVQEERTEQVFETIAKLRSHHEPIDFFIISPENICYFREVFSAAVEMQKNADISTFVLTSETYNFFASQLERRQKI